MKQLHMNIQEEEKEIQKIKFTKKKKKKMCLNIIEIIPINIIINLMQLIKEI